MKSKLLILMIFGSALLSGCVKAEYCDIAKPMYFDSEATVDYLLREDQALLRSILTHNEVTETVCPNV
jgi:uncharacterized protein YceK